MARGFPDLEPPLALTPDNSNRAFIREVDEEVRRERVADLWSRWGVQIVLAIVAVLVIAGIALWWRSHREAQRGMEGEQLQAAYDKLAADDAKGASAALAPIVRDGGPGYRSLARMTQADIALRGKDTAGAATLFGQIAGDDAVPATIRQRAVQMASALGANAPQRQGGPGAGPQVQDKPAT